MKTLHYKVPSGSDLYEFLAELAIKENISGFVVGIVGDLTKATIQCPEQSSPMIFEETLEIISLNGTFSTAGVHLHLCVSDHSCKVWGGHLEKGSSVLKGVEMLLVVEALKNEYGARGSKTNQTSIPRIELVVIKNCPWSERAVRIVRTLGLPHRISLIETEEAFLNLKKRSNSASFPQIFIDDKFIGGYAELVDLNGSGKLKTIF